MLLILAALAILLVAGTYMPHAEAAVTTGPAFTMPYNSLGLVGWWTFDNIVNNVPDSSGQGNTGYMVAAATSSQQVAGQIGPCA